MTKDASSRLTSYILRELPDLATAKLDIEYDYPSVPLCVIDAVFSMGVRYESTRRTVLEFCRNHGWEPHKLDGAAERTVTELIDILEPFNGQFEEADPFHNRQRTSSRTGITKAEAVYRFAKTLRDHRVEIMADARQHARDPELSSAIRAIPGQGSGISFSYFLILVGHRDIVKPDRMLRRFVANALGLTDIPQSEAEELVIEASKILQGHLPDLTAAALDNAIWKHQRLRADLAKGFKSPGSSINADQDELYLASNLYPCTTGLPMTVWISLRGNLRRDVQIKVNMIHGNQATIDNTAVIAVCLRPHVVSGHLSPSDEQAVFAWIAPNVDTIVAYWNGEIDTLQLARALRPLGT